PFPIPQRLPSSTLIPYTTLFRSDFRGTAAADEGDRQRFPAPREGDLLRLRRRGEPQAERAAAEVLRPAPAPRRLQGDGPGSGHRSEEHTSELQSRENLVCRLLLE